MTKEKYIELVRKSVGNQPDDVIDRTWERHKSKTDEEIQNMLALAELDWALGPVFKGNRPYDKTSHNYS